MKIIDFEAHFYCKSYMDVMYARQEYPYFQRPTETEIRKLWYHKEVGQPFVDDLLNRLLDMTGDRLKSMDRLGIDSQIISLSAPGIEQLDPETGTELARKANNDLAEAIHSYPDRFMGYAALAPKAPAKAADELERAVTELGFVGWNTHSNFGDSYLDDEKFWPILERAEKLKIPIYIHPTVPAIAPLRKYGFPLAGAPFGFGLETAMCMMRIIYSGLLDRYPNLTFILGHLGEALPFLMKRIDWAYVRPFDPKSRPKLAQNPSYYLRNNVFVTTSGNYYQPAFNCTIEAMGIDRILLGTDYPYENPEECISFIDSLPLKKIDRNKILSKNAEKLL